MSALPLLVGRAKLVRHFSIDRSASQTYIQMSGH